jgi:hypothetical protein
MSCSGPGSRVSPGPFVVPGTWPGLVLGPGTKGDPGPIVAQELVLVQVFW